MARLIFKKEGLLYARLLKVNRGWYYGIKIKKNRKMILPGQFFDQKYFQNLKRGKVIFRPNYILKSKKETIKKYDLIDRILYSYKLL